MKTTKALLSILTTAIFFQAGIPSGHAEEINPGETTQTEAPVQATAPASAPASTWQVSTIALPSLSDPKPVTMKIGIHLPPAGIPVKSVLLYVSVFSRPEILDDKASILVTSKNPWLRNAALLNKQGIAVVFADTSSDANGHYGSQRPTELKRDTEQAIKSISNQFPQLPIDVGVFFDTTILNIVNNISGVRKTIVVSGNFIDARTSDWRKLGASVLLIQAPSASCNFSPYLDAQFAAQKNNFALVKAGYKKQETSSQCTATAQSGLWSLNNAFVDTVAKWLNNEEIPAVFGYKEPVIAWHEEIVNYRVPASFGALQLEMTLLFPEGAGPFPVVLFNHGDIEFGSPEIQYKRRFRDMIVAQEFLQQGLAVAFPSRHGVGLSEGVYMPSSASDADASYVARLHAKDIFPALDYLRNRPEIDRMRIIIAGQSSGGFSTMYIASQNPEGVIGAINFSGGRADHLAGSSPKYLNSFMVNGYEEFGKTIHIPSLWIYAENDSRFTVNTIHATYDAFTHAGGKATLLLTPPTQIDGHFVYRLPQLWRPALEQYLKELGIEKPPHNDLAVKNTPAVQ